MNRREALAALTSLPGLTSVQVADLKPNDVIVAELAVMHASMETIARVKTVLEDVWPGRKIVVTDQSIKLKVMREQG